MKSSNLLFVLMFFCSISFLITSCSKEDVITPTEITAQEDGGNFLIPQELGERGEEAINAHLESLSDQELANYRNEYLIMDALKSAGQLSEAEKMMANNGLSFSDLSLIDFLPADQIRNLEAEFQAVEDSDARECHYHHVYYACGTHSSGGTIYCYSHSYIHCT